MELNSSIRDWRNPVFQIMGRSYLWPLYLRMFWRILVLKTTAPVRFLTMDSNLNNRLVDHRKKWGIFSDFKYSFRSSWLTVDLLTVASDIIAWAFDRSGTLELWHLIYQRLCTSFDMLDILAKSYLTDISVFKLKLQFLKAPFLCLPFSYYTLWLSWWYYLQYYYLYGRYYSLIYVWSGICEATIRIGFWT